VGQNSSRNRAFLTSFDAGGNVSLVDLGALPNLPSTRAYAINPRGQIVGASGDGDKSRAFLWNPGVPNSASGSMVEIEDLPGERNNTSARGINAIGQVVGYSIGRAFLWTPTVPNGTTGTAIDLEGLPGGNDASFAFGVNASGQVVGFSNTDAGDHAFLWTPNSANGTTGAMIDLGNLPGASGLSQAAAINDAGAVVGNSVTASGPHAFLWRPTAPNGTSGTMIDLGDLEGGNDESFAFALDAREEVVGYSNSAASNHPFVWTQQNGMVDLNTVLDESGAAWELLFAQGINDAGQIVGSGIFDPDGPGEIAPATHAYRLEPIAELVVGRLYISRDAEGAFTLRFVALRGARYQVEGATDLIHGWQPVGDAITGAGGIATIHVPQSGDRGFWRVTEVAPQSAP
jgi:probable HAF family extracellular repeat protein